MSRISFHSESDGFAEVRGSERARFSLMASSMLLEGLGLSNLLSANDIRRVHDAMTKIPSYVQGNPEHLRTYLRIGQGEFRVGDSVIPAWLLGLNSMIANGSDPVILGARLHGQCEVHCFVEGPNRGWLAEIIDYGLGTGIFLDRDGWRSAADLLRRSEVGAVVTSYSVGDSFPSADLVGADEEQWDSTDDRDKWSLCMTVIRSQPGLELTPLRWRWPDFYFAHAVTAAQLLGGECSEVARDQAASSVAGLAPVTPLPAWVPRARTRKRLELDRHWMPSAPCGWFWCRVSIPAPNCDLSTICLPLLLWWNEQSIDGWYVGEPGRAESLFRLLPRAIVLGPTNIQEVGVASLGGLP